VKQSLAGANQIRLVLATPAVFQHGWRPDWLKDGLVGSPPGAKIKLRLVGVSIGRWKAVSGWSLAPPRGPKPIRRLVPAGGVYFFTVVEGEPTELENHWLQSVSDEKQAQRDGFGLAVWGAW
jgi:CRISPR-associated protein Cmr3